MIRKSDVRWWVLEAKKHPESAPAIIEELAKRLAQLDAENERLRNEAIRSRRRGAAAVDRAELRALREKVASLQDLVDEASDELVLVLLSDRLQSARLPLAQAQRMVQDCSPRLNAKELLKLRGLVLAGSRDEVVLLTNRGRGSVLRASDVAPLDEGTIWPATDRPPMLSGEWVSAAVTVASRPRFWTIVTRRGFVRQSIRVAFDRALARGDQVMESPLARDEVTSIVSGDDGDLLVVSRWGKAVRFRQRAIDSTGSVAMKLEPDDEVAAALPLPSEAEILVVTAAGNALRRGMARFGAMSRPGGVGKPLIRAFDVLDVFVYEPQAHLLFLTCSGRLVLAPTAHVPLAERSGRGTCLCDLGRDPAIAVICLPAAAWSQS